MKIKLIYLFILFLLSGKAFSQIYIINAENGEKISFAHIFSSDGLYNAVSDMNGCISKRDVDELKNNKETLYISHISYQTKELQPSDLKQGCTVTLTSSTIQLPELQIFAPKVKYDYMRIDGFFRTSQMENNRVKYFADGFISYYIPRKGNRVRIQLKEYRLFRNQTLVDSVETKAISIGYPPNVPFLTAKSILDDFDDDGFSLLTKDNGEDIVKNGVNAGRVTYDSNLVVVSVDKILQEKVKMNHFMGYIIQLQQNQIMERFSSIDVSTVSMKNITDRKQFRRLYYKHKRDKTDFTIEFLEEFFVTNRTYINKSEFKGNKTTSNMCLPLNSLFSDDFEKRVQDLGIQDNDPNFQRELGKTLKMYPEK